MKQKDLLNKIAASIPYYLEATTPVDKAYYEDNLKEYVGKFFNSTFNQKAEFLFEIRNNENYKLSDVCVLGLLLSERADGRIWYDLSTKIPRRYVISFSPMAKNQKPEYLMAMMMYGILTYTVSEFNTRISRCILEIAKTNNLVYDSKELNQLAGVLYYIFGLRPVYYTPVRDFSTNSLLNMLFAVSPDIYRDYCVFTKKELLYGQMLELSTEKIKAIDGSERGYYYINGAEDINDEIIKSTIKEDIATAKTIYQILKDKQLDAYLEKVHTDSGIIHKLKDLLSFQMLNKNLKSSNFVKNYADNITESAVILEGLFSSKDPTSEFRYKINKILVRMDYMDTENDRTAVLVDCYDLKQKLEKVIVKERERRSIDQKAEKAQAAKIEYLEGMMRELSELETRAVKHQIKPKKFGVFVEWPAGYEY